MNDPLKPAATLKLGSIVVHYEEMLSAQPERGDAPDGWSDLRLLAEGSDWKRDSGETIVQWAARTLAARSATGTKDTERLDWLQKVKLAKFAPVNQHAKDISRVRLFTVEAQHVEGNTVRDAIDAAMDGGKDA